MEQRRWLIIALFIFLFSSCYGRELGVKQTNNPPVYNHNLATVLVQYASAAYLSDPNVGLTKGFKFIDLIVDIEQCLQAFVGVAQDLNAIVIAFRGTVAQSIANWVEDETYYWKQLDLPSMPGAMVHGGFYSGYHDTKIRPGVLNAIKKAKETYGDLNIMVTGHSLGGALASFCALDLTVNHEAKNVQLVTFGQPRVGNTPFASYYSKLVPNTIRVINEYDIVPHVPPYSPFSFAPQMTYHHFPREVWLINGVEKVCDDSGEDPTCSGSGLGNSFTDHVYYFGVIMGAGGSCAIALDPRVEEHGSTDLKGNFTLSRDSATPNS